MSRIPSLRVRHTCLYSFVFCRQLPCASSFIPVSQQSVRFVFQIRSFNQRVVNPRRDRTTPPILGVMSNSAHGTRGPEVPDWAESLLCADNTQCVDGECEFLHKAEGWQRRCCSVPSGRGKLVICAGPERSGSTWLFNAVRLLLEQSGERVHSYWIHSITEAKLLERGVGRQSDSANVLVKTHAWSSDWDPSIADLVVLTERNICGVVDSYLRVGWLPKDMRYLKNFTKRYLQDHRNWKQVAHAVIPYEDLADVGGREMNCLNQLQDMLKLNQTDLGDLSSNIRALSIPQYGGPDPVTKLWPQHIGSSENSLSRRLSLSVSECKIVTEHATLYLPP